MAAKTKIIVKKKSSASKINRSVGVTKTQAATAAKAVSRAKSVRVHERSVSKSVNGRSSSKRTSRQ